MTSYEEVMAMADKYRDAHPAKKDAIYDILKKALTWVVRPVSYERAVRELCKRMNY